jgi:hypothetical protein
MKTHKKQLLLGSLVGLLILPVLRFLDLVIPKQWRGKYRGFLLRLLISIFSPTVGPFALKLMRTNLSEAHLRGANLRFADLSGFDLRGADLTKANLMYSNLIRANLSNTNLSGASVLFTNLVEANLSGANLTNADLKGANLSHAKLDGTKLVGTFVYGTSAWNVNLETTIQLNLIITRPDEPPITVDNLEVAQFIYLLLDNKKIHTVIDSVTSKVVLILGRFTPERKATLDALKEELRKQNYSPIVFDFDRPESRDFTETVRTLAHLSRFILADITEPSSIPQELLAIVPELEVPVQPLLEEGKRQYPLFPDFRKYPWVFPLYLYKDQASLIASLKDEIIEPADKRAIELGIEKAKRLESH